MREWHKENLQEYPWRTTKNHWLGLVAEMMLQRTNADQVTPVYKSFAREFPDAKSFLKSARNTRRNYFSSLGLKWRNRYLRLAAEEIITNGIPLKKKTFKESQVLGNM